MPGIAAIFARNPAALRDHSSCVATMVGCMRHESYYGTGRFYHDQLGVTLGWTHHPGFSPLPIWNQAKDMALIFLGEDFSDSPQGDRIVSGEIDPDKTKGEHLLELFDQRGIDFLEQLNGCFCGLLIDLRMGTVTLFNDRYGLNRIYFYERKDVAYFCSEAKSLLRVLPELRDIDHVGLSELLATGCTMKGRTLFKGITYLPGGSKWTFSRDRQLQKGTYFRPQDWEGQVSMGGDEFYRELRKTFTRILPRYLHRADNLGLSLTGGLDGRMILANAAATPGTLPCYTFGGPFRDCADVKLARELAAACKQSHTTISVGDEFLSDFPSLAERAVRISDGTMDVTGSVELYVNRLARNIAPVRLTGNYGSEIMRGNVAFKPNPLNEQLYCAELVSLGREASRTYAVEAECHPLTFIAFKQVPWYHYSRLSLEQSQLTMRSPYLDNELIALMYRKPKNLVDDKLIALKLVAEGNSYLSRFPTDRGLLYSSGAFSNCLRNWIHEFSHRAEYAYDYGMPQWLARIDSLLTPMHVERAFLGRHKFYHFRIWYRDRLAKYLKEILLDPVTARRTCFRPTGLLNMVESHLSGRANYTMELHQALTVELIYRQLLDA